MDRLKQVLSSPDDSLNLVEAALLIACEEYPGLDTSEYMGRIAALSDSLQRRLRKDISPADTIRALNAFLFVEHGFAPDTGEYHDPRNCFLNEVLDRKIGIPIILSILYMEVGNRLGLQFEGISFPGHFLVKCPLRGGVVILDPFAGGISLSVGDLQQRLQNIYGGDAPAETAVTRMLVGASKKEILARILRNLKNIYLYNNQLPQALSATDRIITLTPEAVDEIRDRGLIYFGLECYRPAKADIQHYLQLVPEATDAEELRERLIELHTLSGTIN